MELVVQVCSWPHLAGNYHKQDANQTPPTSTQYFWSDQIAVIAKDFLGIVPSGPRIKKEKRIQIITEDPYMLKLKMD